MLELFILYFLNKQENTLYGLKKAISEYFGEISKPSHGALHPALKRLIAKNLITVRKKISDGGKRYTYYSVSKNFSEVFNEKFMNLNSSETLDAFLTEIKCRIFVSDLLDENLKKEFKEKSILILDKHLLKLKEKTENPYIELNDAQKNLLQCYGCEIEELKKQINSIF